MGPNEAPIPGRHSLDQVVREGIQQHACLALAGEARNCTAALFGKMLLVDLCAQAQARTNTKHHHAIATPRVNSVIGTSSGAWGF